MMAGVISVIMRLANFGVFIGLIIYAYQRYIKEFLYRLVEQDARIVEGLEKEQEAVMFTHARYKKVAEQTEQQRLRLQKMIAQWEHVIAQQNELRMQEKQERVEQLKRVEEHRAQVLHASSIVTIVAPETVVRARENLIHIYSNEKEGADFVHRIITYLQESKP